MTSVDNAVSNETTEWTGHPSQWRNLGWFCLAVLIIPLPWSAWKWLETRAPVYTLTDQRLRTSRGVLGKTTEDLELYRVRDTKLQQSAFERLLGLGEIILFTTDTTSPEIRLPFIRDAETVREKIRALVEARRDAKRVRYLDAE